VTSVRLRAGMALGLAVVLGGLVGCGEVQESVDQANEAAEQVRGAAEQAGEAADQARDAVGHAGQLWSEARELGELTVDQVNAFDWSSLEEHWGTYLGDNSGVTEFLRSMPSGPDMESFEIIGKDGKLVVHYGDHVTEADPAVLRETMENVATEAKKHIENLETVEFRAGDEIYTF
jgi:hypothetical protein